jgi:predicted membrane protein
MLNLEGLKVDNLNIDAGLGQISIRYPDYNNETEISAGASNIKLVIPEETAFRIETSTVLNNMNFEEVGLIKVQDDIYQSMNYGEVENRIKIKLSTSVGNIKVQHN